MSTSATRTLPGWTSVATSFSTPASARERAPSPDRSRVWRGCLPMDGGSGSKGPRIFEQATPATDWCSPAAASAAMARISRRTARGSAWTEATRAGCICRSGETALGPKRPATSNPAAARLSPSSAGHSTAPATISRPPVTGISKATACSSAGAASSPASERRGRPQPIDDGLSFNVTFGAGPPDRLRRNKEQEQER